jgi:hypothetical protein
MMRGRRISCKTDCQGVDEEKQKSNPPTALAARKKNEGEIELEDICKRFSIEIRDAPGVEQGRLLWIWLMRHVGVGMRSQQHSDR